MDDDVRGRKVGMRRCPNEPSSENVLELLPEISAINDEALRDKVVNIWVQVWSSAQIGGRLREMPFSLQAEHERLIPHVRKVTRLALSLLDFLKEDGHYPDIDRDTLLAGCLLHDIDKLLLIEPAAEGTTWKKSAISSKFPHGGLGAMWCYQQRLPEAVVHLVATHAVDSPTPPRGIEGLLLHYADHVVADVAFFEAGAPLLSNRLSIFLKRATHPSVE